ncbi:MAG: metallo-beta-lactamase family protein [Bryobacterales bacterium]|jgi:metallo-beta-lactamase family protein|nr:metallo-beta-lactamase family protein [Bryobacterales bacterium]
MKLTFAGAAGTVTGSMHQLEVDGKRYLLDCGMFQGRRKEAEQRNRWFPFPAPSIDAVVLSHAHIDHSGRLPLLTKNGFRGPIYATSATVDLCNAMLLDTAHILESDADFVNRRHPGEEVAEPLYSKLDAEETMPLFQPVRYRIPVNIGNSLVMESYDAGHVLGSASVVLTDGKTRLAYSGDVGRPGLPIIRDPEALPPVDYLIMESTYGGRKHPQENEAVGKLESVMKDTIGRGGRLIVPAFAVGRTQQLVLLLHHLMNENRLPSVPIFVDSPLAVNVTEVFRAHPECFDTETYTYLQNGEDPFGFKRLTYIRDARESKQLNDIQGPFIVISPSGMCETGRVLHHLRHNVGNPKNTVLLTGYQAENTLGRKLKDGMKNVRIFGIPMEVRAVVESLDELSGHADSGELLDWMRPMTPTLKRVFLVHGEPVSSRPLAEAIHARYGIEAVVAEPGQVYEI